MSASGSGASFSLPQDRANQVYVSMKAMKVGTLTLADRWVFQDASDANTPDNVRMMIPDYAFLLEHPTKGKIMFDLGMRKVSALELIMA